MVHEKKDQCRDKRLILLVDNDSGIRCALRELIDHDPTLTVGSAVESFDQARIIVEEQSFDLAIVDISLDDKNGLELTRIMKFKCPDMSIVMFSSHDDLSHVKRALRSGARSYLVKAADTPEEILTAIHQVLDGRFYISRQVTQQFSTNETARISANRDDCTP